MSKRILIFAFALVLLGGLSLMAGGKEGSWTGWVTDTHCGAKHQSAAGTGCINKCVKEMGAKYALYNTADKKVYVLDPQDKAAEHAGHHVTVKGTVEGDTIKVASFEMAPEPKSDK